MKKFILLSGMMIGFAGILSSCSQTAVENNGNNLDLYIQSKQSNKIKEMEVKSEENNRNNKPSADYTTKEWQASFKEVAIGEAESFVQLSEKKGGLSEERIKEYSKVVLQQADKIVDEQIKEDLITLSNLIRDNKLTEIKSHIQSLH